MAPFSSQDLVLGEPEHLSAERLPLRIWARLTGLSALTNDVIDGQNKAEHTKTSLSGLVCQQAFIKWLPKVYSAACLITQ